MRKKVFQISSLILVAIVALSFSLSACGSGSPGTTSTTAGTAASTTADTAASTGSSSAVDKSPITLTLCFNKNTAKFPEGVQNNEVFNEIAKETGVTLQIEYADTDKYKVLIAGGDLADITQLEIQPSEIISLATSGQLQPLDDLLSQYGQNIEKAIPQFIQYAKSLVPDGKAYFLPVPGSITKYNKDAPSLNNNECRGFYFRYDIYKAIGSPKMNNEDDFLNVLKQMQDYAQAKAPAGKKVYALSAFTDWGDYPYIWPYISEYGYSPAGYNNQNYIENLETGEIQNCLLDSDGVFWKGIEYFNKAYRMGIFDPEGFTQKYDQYNAKMQDGLLLTTSYTWDAPKPEKCGENAALVMVPGAFPYVNGYAGIDRTIGSLANGWAISSNCKNPDRAMQVFDFINSSAGSRLVLSGVKGKDWDVVDGKPQIIGERLDLVKQGKNGDYDTQNGISDCWPYFKLLPVDGYPADLRQSPDFIATTASAGMKAFAQDYGKSYPGEVYASWVDSGIAKSPTSVPIANQIMQAPSVENGQIEVNADQYFMSNVSKVIMAKSDAAFASAKAAIIDGVTKLGEDKAYEAEKAAFADAKAKASGYQQ